MRSFVLLVLCAGCFAEARGGGDAVLRSRRDRHVTAHGSAAVGIGAAGATQAGAVMLGIGTSPLGTSADAAGVPVLSFVGRYERSWSAARPDRRWYGRLTMGGNPCEGSEAMEGTVCSGRARAVGVVSLGVGLAFAGTVPHPEASMDWSGSVGVGVVYTAASDDAFGTGDFLGVELSVFGGGDFLSPIATTRDKD